MQEGPADSHGRHGLPQARQDGSDYQGRSGGRGSLSLDHGFLLAVTGQCPGLGHLCLVFIRNPVTGSGAVCHGDSGAPKAPSTFLSKHSADLRPLHLVLPPASCVTWGHACHRLSLAPQLQKVTVGAPG